MILTVTLNAALDVTYTVQDVTVGAPHRVADVALRPGGKGLNVARCLHALGVPVRATGLAGGHTGALIRAEIRAAGLPDDLVEMPAESRRTVTVVAADGSATAFNEDGPVVPGPAWEALRARVRELLGAAEVVVLSGSLPRGLGADVYAQLIRDVGTAAPVLLDASGDALLAGLAARPALVKPNLDELRAATGVRDPLEGARILHAAGDGTAVVASLGPDGLLALTPEGDWRARLDEPVPGGNPTGAGDALVAALAVGIVRGQGWPERLRHAVALSAAAVRSPVAGEADHAWADRAVSRVRVEAL